MAERWWIDLQGLRAKNPHKYPELKPRVLRSAGPDVGDNLDEGDLAWRQRMLNDYPGLTKPYEYLTTEPLVHHVTATTDEYPASRQWEIYDPDHQTALDRLWIIIGAVCAIALAGWRATGPARAWIWARLEAALLAVLRWFYEDSLDWLQERVDNADRRAKKFNRWTNRRLSGIECFLKNFLYGIRKNFRDWTLDRKTEQRLARAARRAVDARSFPGLTPFFVGVALGLTEATWFMGAVVSHWNYVPTTDFLGLLGKLNGDDFAKMILVGMLTGVSLAALHVLVVDRRRRLYFLRLMQRRPAPLGRLTVVGLTAAAVVAFLPIPALFG